jgi:protease-4
VFPDVDYWLDRRRLKRSLTWWRVIAVLALVAAVVTGIGRYDNVLGGRYVARIAVDGIILDDRERDEALARLAKDGAVRAVIVRIDSPGGTVVGGETLFRRLRDVAQAKPVVAVMGEVATSAAYMTALGSDHIVASEGTITGSIGVILQTTDVTELMGRIGVKPETIKSGPLKAQPNPFEPFSPEAREATRKIVTDMYEMFMAMVADRRGLDRAAVRGMADGRVFTGRQALASGLIDAVGGEDEARAWLEQQHQIDRGLPVRDISTREPQHKILDLVDGLIGKALYSKGVRLDGLMSVWHPAL